MEQKRTLLIVAAVGIFLLVVLGAAIILNSASSTASKMDTGNSVPTVSSTDWLLSDSNLSTISSVQDLNQDGSIATENVGTTEDGAKSDEMLLNPLSTEAISTAPVATVTQTQTTSNVKATTDAAATAMQQTSTYVPSSTPATAPSVTITQNNYSSQSAPVTVITPKPATTATKVAPKPTTSKPAAKIGKYWVQVGSFTKKSGADSTRSSLSTQGIESEIFTYTTNDGSTGYRVRVGPYQTKSEADYWQKLIEEKTGTKGYVAETK